MKIKNLFTDKDGSSHVEASVFNSILVVLFLLIFTILSLHMNGLTLDFSFLSDFTIRIRDGFLMTIKLSALSLVFSLLIGALAAWGRSCHILFFRYLADIYVTLLRGTPLIMQIYLFYYIIGTAWGIDNRFAAGVIILSMFEGAYIAEIFRGSLLSLDQNQLEAAEACGFTDSQTFRYIILPQMTARTLPALTGQFASIIKDSSLLSIIAVIELTQTMREISASNFKLFECYLFLGVLYLCLTLPITAVSAWLERRYNYEH